MNQRNRAILLLVALGALLYWLISNSRAAAKTPRYRLVRTDGPVQIRDYPRLAVATVPMRRDAMDNGFRQLFRYITGGNQSREKIAMTTPVLMDCAAAGETMAFIMPEGANLAELPLPLDHSVSISEIDAARYAVLRFGGPRSRQNESRAVAALNEWLVARELPAQGAAIIAYYDPPWTPWFLRRNEILIPVAADALELARRTPAFLQSS